MAITSSASGIGRIESILGEEAEDLLGHECTTIARDRLHLPGPDFVDRVVKDSDRPTPVLRSLQSLFSHGRLDGTGYVSILPVDQGIEHSAGASFAKNPDYFDPEGIIKLAIEGGCNAVASTLGVLGACARKYAHHIPFIVKLNHNEFLSYPNAYDQIMFAQVRQAREMGAVAVGATIYFGSPESKRQIVEVSEAFAAAHDHGGACGHRFLDHVRRHLENALLARRKRGRTPREHLRRAERQRIRKTLGECRHSLLPLHHIGSRNAESLRHRVDEPCGSNPLPYCLRRGR